MSNAYHQILLPEEDREKTSFVTDEGSFQYRVMPFGLSNAPATFQRLMNQVFGEAGLLNKHVLVYLDDILCLAETPEDHLNVLGAVFEVLKKHQFRLKLSKCEFGRTKLKFLGHVISDGKITVDPDKVKVLRDWLPPINMQQLRRFLGLANYFRRFIPKFSITAAPLTSLTSPANAKAYPWHAWRPPELNAFQQLKDALSSPDVVLNLPELDKPFSVYADASDLGTGAILIQNDRPVAYTSHKFTGAELNWTTGDKELFALVHACKQWRCYLDGTEVELVTDHNPLTFLTTQTVLSRRQARWMEYLSRFNFKFRYIKGERNVADPISRIPCVAALTPSARVAQDHLWRSAQLLVGRSRGGGGGNQAQRATQAQPAEPTDPSAGQEPEPMDVDPVPEPPGTEEITTPTDGTPVTEEGTQNDEVEVSLKEAIQAAYTRDERFADPVGSGVRHLKWKPEVGLWYSGDQIAVPRDQSLRTRIIREHHNPAWAGHKGIAKTYDLVNRQFHWLAMRQDVTDYVLSCDVCQKVKADNKLKAGTPQAMPIPDAPWDSVSMDFITKLPQSTKQRYDTVLVFVDRLTKYVILVPTVEAIGAKGVGTLFVKHVYADHGLPRSLVTDRDTRFTAKFWKAVMKKLGIKQLMSTAYHPQTDGQTERANRIIEEMLRAYVGPTQTDWATWLPVVQFAINNSRQESVQHTPFFLNYGRHPNLPTTLEFPGNRMPDAESFVDKMQETLARAKTALQAAQQRMVRQAKKHARDVEYNLGDKVLLSTKNMRPAAGVKKLMPKYLGPFEITELVGPVAVRLALTSDLSRLHDVFHVSLIKPYNEATDTPPAVTSVPLDYVGGLPVYEVEAITAHQARTPKSRKRKEKVDGKMRVTAYYVKWRGFDESHDSWEPTSCVDGCDNILTAYWAALGKQIAKRNRGHDIVVDV
jgi:transposase InsO family protein